MKPKVALILLVLLLFGVPSAVLAEVSPTISGGVVDLEYQPALGTVTVNREERTATTTFTDMRGVATVNCENEACTAAGLNGARMIFVQDTRIVIDVIDAGVVGGARGRIILMDRGLTTVLARMRFAGVITGTSDCSRGRGRVTCDLTMDLAGVTTIPGSSQQGTIDLDLTGRLAARPGGARLWDLGGNDLLISNVAIPDLP